MEVLENTGNARQIDHRTINYYVIKLISEVQKSRNQCTTTPLSMLMSFPCPILLIFL